MLYSKTLFFIDDQKSQIFKFQIFAQHTVRTYHDIHQTAFCVLNCLFLLRRSTEPAHQVDSHRKLLHALHKRIIMLLGKYRRRNEIHHLLILLHCLKCRTDRNLCLAVSHISTDQAIHDLGALHIFFRRLNCKQLILRLLKRKHLLKFSLPYGILSIDKSMFFLSCRIQFDKILCNLFYCPTNSCLRLRPLLSTKPIKLWFLCICACVLLNQIQLSCRNIQIPARRISNFHIVFGNFIHLNLFDSLINPQSMIFMYYIISDLQF